MSQRGLWEVEFPLAFEEIVPGCFSNTQDVRDGEKSRMNVEIKTFVTVKDTLPLTLLRTLPSASSTVIPSLWPPSEAALEVLHRVLSCAVVAASMP